jgi:arginyl-tRNA synthetase
LYLETQARIRAKFVTAVQDAFALEVPEPVLGFPPSVEMGEVSIAGCYDLAKKLRQPPRKIAEQLAAKILPLEGVERTSVAGGGYLNFHLDRSALASALFKLRAERTRAAQPGNEKILVEHTSINPNKAAHIGHLRNAVLGDSLVRLLRFRGHRVEIQNYIDNTGVQVADVVAGFLHLEKKSLADVQALLADPSVRFDYYCWDLYARVFQHYEQDKASLAWRGETLQAIEEGEGDPARMAELISTAIVRKHLETMLRIGVRYDLLVGESEILRLDFWKYAFELLKKRGAVYFEDSGKNQGCWVMRLDAPGEKSAEEPNSEEDVKIIVRSNGTVTYVGKDIAYHLWKFAALGRDFGYQRFHRYADGHQVWRTATAGSPDAPSFGRATVAYGVIDTRQAYLQNIVVAALRALGLTGQADHLFHFAYEVVGLTPGCAEEMGVELSDEDRARNYIEVSGRKGLGVKADDLMDRLEEKALQEVRSRELTPDPADQLSFARMISAGALRYFLLKFSRRIIIAFDFKEALAFEGETGPYLQYSVVRAKNIFRKYREQHADFSEEKLGNSISEGQLKKFFYAREDASAFWELALLSAQAETVAEQAIASEEPSVLAKYAFRLAQAFNNFYHHYHILNEPDPERQQFLLYLVYLASESLRQTLEVLGIEVPERM